MKKLDFEKLDRYPNKYIIRSENISAGSYKLSFLLDSKKHDLKKYFLYQSLKKNAKKYSFPNMDFSSIPPGERFGPWPGWRAVPEMPPLLINIDGIAHKVKYYFIGDEEIHGKLHAYVNVRFDKKPQNIIFEVRSTEIILERIYLHKAERIELNQIDLKIFKEKLTVHPRLLFDSADVIKFRENQFSDKWQKIISLFKNWNLNWEINEESRTLPGKERLNIIDKMVISAFHALITEEPDPISRALKTFSQYITESSQGNYIPMQIDTQIGECLYCMCLAYDWLFNYMSNQEKESYRNYIEIVSEKLIKFLDHERDDYAQAHFLGCVSGLLAYSFLFYNEHKAKKSIEFIARAFSTAMHMLPADASYPHGINLWIYEYTFLTRITELLFRFTNQNHWKYKKFWINSSLFRNCAASFDGKYGITFGDPQYRVCGDAYIHYLISQRVCDRESYEFAEKISDINTSGVDYRSVIPRRRIYEFIYLNENANKKITPLGHFKYFKDTGQIFIKDESEKLLITLKAGPPLGKKRHDAGEWGGYGHSDPCNGSFLILRNNKLLVCGPESTYKRSTAFHNTITINGYGQYGDKMVWAPDFYLKKWFAKITHAVAQKEFDHFSMDLTNCYFDFLKAKKIKREFVFIKPGILFGIDTIELDKSSSIEWNLHSYGKFSVLPGGNSGHCDVKIGNGKEGIFLKILNSVTDYKIGLTPFIPGYPNSGKRDHFFKNSVSGKNAQFLYMFILNDDIAPLEQIIHCETDDSWRLNITYNNRKCLIKYNSGIKSVKVS